MRTTVALFAVLCWGEGLVANPATKTANAMAGLAIAVNAGKALNAVASLRHPKQVPGKLKAAVKRKP